MAFQSHTLLSSLPIITFCILIAIPHATSLSFDLTKIGPKNLNVDIITYNDAYISSDGIHLGAVEGSTDFQQRAGRATYAHPLRLWTKASGKLTDFTTRFSFVVDSNESSDFADGLAFFLAPTGASDNTPGGAMGLPINPTTIEATSPFVAVEFDTYQNSWDPQNITPVTHVGIDINSLTSNATKVWYNNIPQGIENEALIRYKSKKLSVVFTGFLNNTKVQHDLHFLVDLRDYLPEWVTFGFSASTGGLFEKNIVKSWQFHSSL